MSVVFLHVGAGKTGTSAIQAALAAYRERLAELGVWYPAPMNGYGSDKRAALGQISSGNAVVLGQLIRAQGRRRDLDVSEVQSWLHRCLDEANGRATLFSSEMMQAPSQPELQQLVDFFRGRGTQIKVLYYVRHLLEHSVSEYQQFLKVGAAARAGGLADYLREFRTDLPRRLHIFADAVGPENVICRLYDDDKPDLLRNFLALISEPAARCPDIGLPENVVNRSPTSVEMRLYEALNRQKDCEQICRLVTDAVMNSAPSHKAPPLVVGRDVFERFTANNSVQIDIINREFLRNGQRLQVTSGAVQIGDEAPLPAGDLLAAAASWVCALARESIAQRNRSTVRIRLLEGQSLLHAGNPPQAIKALSEAVRLDPGPAAFVLLAEAYIAAGEPVKADEQLKKALDARPPATLSAKARQLRQKIRAAKSTVPTDSQTP
jgi:tetratricopeptide (TPR) repeat protein